MENLCENKNELARGKSLQCIETFSSWRGDRGAARTVWCLCQDHTRKRSHSIYLHNLLMRNKWSRKRLKKALGSTMEHYGSFVQLWNHRERCEEIKAELGADILSSPLNFSASWTICAQHLNLIFCFHILFSLSLDECRAAGMRRKNQKGDCRIYNLAKQRSFLLKWNKHCNNAGKWRTESKKSWL